MAVSKAIICISFLSEVLQAFEDLGVQKRQPAQNLAQFVSGTYV